jgi:hypothetical protein
MSRPNTASARTLLQRYALPALALISFIWTVVENRSRQAGVDPRTGLDTAGMPFATIPMVWSVGVGCLVVVSLLLAIRRRGRIAGLCALVAILLLFILRLNSFWPD